MNARRNNETLVGLNNNNQYYNNYGYDYNSESDSSSEDNNNNERNDVLIGPSHAILNDIIYNRRKGVADLSCLSN